jgi:hypothetical protein
MASFPRCAGRLRDGQPSDRTVTDGSGFCVHHARTAESRGADAVKQGLPRRRAARAVSEPLIIAMDEETEVAETTAGNDVIDPATVRPRLAKAAAEGVEGIRKTLLDAATGAVRDHWVTFEMRRLRHAQAGRGSCPRRSSSRGRDRALAPRGLGRPPQAEETPAPRLPTSAAAVTQMGLDELQILGATLFAEQIVSVAAGGDGLLRQRLASLGPDERRILREALAEPEFF